MYERGLMDLLDSQGMVVYAGRWVLPIGKGYKQQAHS
jgi:hypothetical protein